MFGGALLFEQPIISLPNISLDIKQHVLYYFMPGGIVGKYESNCLSLKMSLTVRNI
jgi:hypothetical protein